MRELVKIFKVLSDENRLRVLNLILKQECCVCEVMQALQISQSKASRDLNALYDAGLLKMRKVGLWALFSLDREGMPAYAAQIVEAVKSAMAGNKTLAKDMERLKKATRIGPKCARCTDTGKEAI